MKKLLFIIFLTTTLLLPIYAQEAELNEAVENELDENIYNWDETHNYDFLANEDQGKNEDTEWGEDLESDQPEKKAFTFARELFEIGFVAVDTGVSNDLFAVSKLFKKEK
jgi:hypothetical protein